MDPTNSGGHLLSFVERIERLHDDKKAIEDDIKEVYAEAKGTGFDTKIIREVVKRRGSPSSFPPNSDGRPGWPPECTKFRCVVRGGRPHCAG